MASKRHGMITRTAFTYEVMCWLQSGKRELRDVVLTKRNDDKALRVSLRPAEVRRAEIRAIYKDVYAMAPLRFYEHAEIITRLSILMEE